ncbi:outer membrane protein [Legionella hackeliae]|uniref:Outer membrane protein beta-barrel domain-containing protein n=1 Tax=Legionella hackeliae TaxID=449 RepID=A0A0A8USZ4_LEGHA|nr:hypothetical protein [Legionella hackeliae]KTD08763.1 hypothetical protein Lhac_2986 [Legionella hackeliae]CEK10192.1 exported protein of unknown function [Legionella hackeliae]STX46916.1 Opacity protein and related surface antigens [Legionella hackeliae]
MKNLLKLTLAGLLTTSTTSFAYYPADGWYFGMFLTGSYVPTQDFTLTTNQLSVLYKNIYNYNKANHFEVGDLQYVPLPTNGNGEIKYQFGGGLGGQLGYRWCGFRFEGELLFNYNTYKNITIDGLSFGKNQQTVTTTSSSTTTATTITVVTNPYSMSGHAQVGAGLFNVLYEFYNHEGRDVSWIPYLGVGVGFANIKNDWVININQVNPNTGTYGFTSVLDVNDGETTPIAQAILGIDYQMDDYFSVGMDYRYLTSKQLNNTNDRFTFHTLNFNFNYWMNA